MDKRQLLTRRPWRKIKPDFGSTGVCIDDSDINAIYDSYWESDMLREFYPTGHKINSPMWYPDIYREVWEDILDDEGNPTGKKVRRVYREYVPRYAFAFEQIIALKHIIHITGNDVQCDLSVSKPSKEQCSDYEELRQGWLMKDMEIALYEAIKSYKIVANAAIVGYMNDGTFGTKVLSAMNGDILYPHFDSLTGKLKCFARRFNDYDDEGNEIVQWLEVWDDKNLYRYKRNADGSRSVSDVILGIFGIDGWRRVGKPEPHGFPFVPVAFARCEDGPCWFASRSSIDSYDLSFSQMAHNNEAFGEPILVLQNDGEDMDIQHGLNGTIKTLSMSTESKASYLEGQSAAESYQKQLDTLYRMIYEQSFAVIPPEMKSGDLPGVALKLLYSPAYEKAMSDASELQPFLNQLVAIFLYGYGMEKGKTLNYAGLPLKWWLKPYIHVNESAVTNDLATAVNAGFMSKQTASERNATYSIVGEWDRIVKERKEQEKADLLYQIKTKQNVSDDGSETE